MESLNAVAVLIGLVKGCSLAYPNLTSGQAFILSLIFGVILGFFHYFGLTIETGIVASLTASGLYQVAKKVGGS